ncbi:hypothetical protein OWR29_25210 [Actinoplanes sp. Pm04-4]|uniref:Pycsar effector protein domain-containing protein n=1 Tax=Paractinoplanes pyxinae TaxID=2997416 RepID=A0ABT4B616_9ACTN|nr:hypothetical protein [Actinoplanes pyxinae]MCY1141310.1 hypothetical protein [Actinoplanes pyxinae]
MNKENELQHDLVLALHTITETNQSIRFADTKAGALAAIQALMITILAGHQGFQPLRVACLLAVFLSVLLLAAGQAPRVFDRAARPNRSSFPGLARTPTDQLLEVPPLEVRHQDAWRQARDLAGIAVVKFRWLSRATVGTVLTLAAVLTWLACITWSSVR